MPNYIAEQIANGLQKQHQFTREDIFPLSQSDVTAARKRLVGLIEPVIAHQQVICDIVWHTEDEMYLGKRRMLPRERLKELAIEQVIAELKQLIAPTIRNDGFTDPDLNDRFDEPALSA